MEDPNPYFCCIYFPFMLGYINKIWCWLSLFYPLYLFTCDFIRCTYLPVILPIVFICLWFYPLYLFACDFTHCTYLPVILPIVPTIFVIRSHWLEPSSYQCLLVTTGVLRLPTAVWSPTWMHRMQHGVLKQSTLSSDWHIRSRTQRLSTGNTP